MKLFSLIAGYAAGLAVAMKYRKNKGTSKLHTDGSTVDAVIDEIVDIHKSAYEDTRSFLSREFSDVHDFESLKSKVAPHIESFADEAEGLITRLKASGTTQKTKLQTELKNLLAEKKALLDDAKSRGDGFSDVAADTIASWIDGARSTLESAHAKVTSTLETKKAVAKKTPAKKPAAKKPTTTTAAKKPAPKKPKTETPPAA